MLSSTLEPYSFINLLLFITAIAFFVSGLEDLFIDLFYWVKRFRFRARSRLQGGWGVSRLRSRIEQPIAIMIPAWQEAEIIQQMLESNIDFLEYEKYIFFVGVYINDPATGAEVDKVLKQYSNVRKAIVPHDGPTCKADCLNWIIQEIFRYETDHRMTFKMIVMHDAEDVIHPLELKLFNYLIWRHDFIQIPVRPLETRWRDMISSSYMDEFAEYHTKDMAVRSILCKVVPSAGVASCFSRKAIMTLFNDSRGEVFNTSSLTEDYDISYKLAKFNISQYFAKYLMNSRLTPKVKNRARKAKLIPLSVGEYFPNTWWTAIRQRTRWNIGIFFQSAGRITWEGGLARKYFFLRDRKGILVNILMLPAYFLTVNILCFWMGHHLFDTKPFSMQVPIWLIYANFILFANRAFQRFIFTTFVYNRRQGMLAIPRIIVSNILNFFSTLRACFIYLESLITKAPIAWDKTTHSYPSMENIEAIYKQFRDVAFKKRILTEKEFSHALQRVEPGKKSLSHVLLSDGVISKTELLEVLTEITHYPPAHWEGRDFSRSSRLLSPRFMREHSLFPLGLGENGTLQVAVPSLLRGHVVEKILMMGFEAVQPFLMLSEDIHHLIDQYAGEENQ